jgi:ribonuclease P protein component
MGEADVPAEQSQAEEDPRLPAADAYPRRPSGAEVASAAGPQAAVGLIWRVRDRATFEALGRARPTTAGPVRVRHVAVGAGPPRVAYVVGRSIGTAVERNRVRRRLRAAVRRHAAALRPATAYLVAANREALSVSFEALSVAVGRALTGEER